MASILNYYTPKKFDIDNYRTPDPRQTVGRTTPTGYQTVTKPVISPSFQNIDTIKANQGGNILGTSSTGGHSRLTQLGQMDRNPVQEEEYRLLQQGQDFGNQAIDQDYDQAMTMIGNQEQSLQGQAGLAQSQIDTEGQATRGELLNTQATAESAQQANLTTAETGAKSAMQQARDVFRQTQQTNNAQLSALGISSSSVAEALAERLGVETARRIAGVTGSLQEVRQNVSQELGRIRTYYQSKLENVQREVANQKAVINQSLMDGLRQLNAARGQAATAKSQARANLLQQTQSAMLELTRNQQEFENSMKRWAAEKAAALKPIVQDPNYLETLMSAASKFNEQFSASGFNFVPELGMNAKGEMTGQIRSYAKKEDQASEGEISTDGKFYYSNGQWIPMD